MSGCAVAASAWSFSAPKVATATAMASSKLSFHDSSQSGEGADALPRPHLAILRGQVCTWTDLPAQDGVFLVLQNIKASLPLHSLSHFAETRTIQHINYYTRQRLPSLKSTFNNL